MRRPFLISGFTLVELMITLLISSVIAAGLYSFIRGQSKASSAQKEKSETLRDSQGARLKLDVDLSRAGFDPHATDPTPCAGISPARTPCPCLPVSTATNDHIVLQGDFDMNNAIGTSTTVADPETIDYQYDAATKRVTRNGSPILIDVESFTLHYYTSAGAELTTPVTTSSSLLSIKKVKAEWTQGSNSDRFELTTTLKNYHGT